MSGAPGILALEGGDPRRPSHVMVGENPPPFVGTENGSHALRYENLHDPSVTFEEYLYWAKISRADARYEHQDHSFKIWQSKSKRQASLANGTLGNELTPVEGKTSGEKMVGGAPRYNITDEEYVQASRAVRTATWGAVFYLITTDILGPFSTPWAFAAMGYGPGVILYTVFGALAGYGGFLLWKMYLGMDSDRYPLKTYSDIAFRVFGSGARYAVNILQSVQLLFNVGIIIIVNGQSLAQVSSNGACFIVLCFVWAIAGMLFGQIRTLQRLGWLANLAIWINLFIIFMTMGIVAHSGVLRDAAALQNQGVTADQPITTTAGARPGTDFSLQVVGLMQAVYSYGGAMLFVEFMAEMKHPWDFWKGMLFAQAFIYFFYMFFGLFVYSYQGQFTINPAYQGIATFVWQTVANSLGLVSSLIAALLYGNVGIKVIYNNVLTDIFHFPNLGTKPGKLLWIAVVPVYWGLAFVVAAAIPQVSNLSGLIAAACILQFSYTFPPMFMLGYQIKKDAMLEGEGFDPVSRQITRHDAGMRRWTRGFMRRWPMNTFNIIIFLGSIVTAILGIYSAALGIKSAYAQGAPPSFSCQNPLGG
ncbi:hypothetical protein MMC30_008344 [Trapelia coarctata]|nr:hypothetical protein [Trapelia coarctata]